MSIINTINLTAPNNPYLDKSISFWMPRPAPFWSCFQWDFRAVCKTTAAAWNKVAHLMIGQKLSAVHGDTQLLTRLMILVSVEVLSSILLQLWSLTLTIVCVQQYMYSLYIYLYDPSMCPLPPVLQVRRDTRSVLCMPIFDKDGNTIGTYNQCSYRPIWVGLMKA